MLAKIGKGTMVSKKAFADKPIKVANVITSICNFFFKKIMYYHKANRQNKNFENCLIF